MEDLKWKGIKDIFPGSTDLEQNAFIVSMSIDVSKVTGLILVVKQKHINLQFQPLERGDDKYTRHSQWLATDGTPLKPNSISQRAAAHYKGELCLKPTHTFFSYSSNNNSAYQYESIFSSVLNLKTSRLLKPFIPLITTFFVILFVIPQGKLYCSEHTHTPDLRAAT